VEVRLLLEQSHVLKFNWNVPFLRQIYILAILKLFKIHNQAGDTRV